MITVDELMEALTIELARKRWPGKMRDIRDRAYEEFLGDHNAAPVENGELFAALWCSWARLGLGMAPCIVRAFELELGVPEGELKPGNEAAILTAYLGWLANAAAERSKS